MRELWGELDSTLSATALARLGVNRSRLIEQKTFPERLATRIASLETLHCALDLVEVAMAAKVGIGFAAKAYFGLGERIGLSWIKEQIDALAVDGQWQAAAPPKPFETSSTACSAI